jgi:hypothetical protein
MDDFLTPLPEEVKPEKEKAKASISPFDFVKSISDTKQNLMVDDDSIKAYIPYIVNKSLSGDVNCVFYANEMNIHSSLTNEMQYDFLLNTISKKKRYIKWYKAPKDEHIDTIIAYYKCSQTKAQEYLSILTEDQIKTLIDKMDTGGRGK